MNFLDCEFPRALRCQRSQSTRAENSPLSAADFALFNITEGVDTRLETTACIVKAHQADMQGGGVSDFIVGSAGYLDAQATYQLPGKARLALALSNLTDTRDLSYEATKARLLQLGSVGRRVQLEVRWGW